MMLASRLRRALTLGSFLPVLLFPAASLRGGEESVGTLLKRACFGCHGARKKSGRLRVDTLEQLLAGGKSGPAIVRGKSGESLLIERVTASGDERMPPEDDGEALTDAEVTLLREWIDGGASAAALETKGTGAVRIEQGALPVAFADTFALAGDPKSPRFAVARGSAVAVFAIENVVDPDKKGDKGRPEAVLKKTLDEQADAVFALAFSPDGSLLAGGEYRTLRIWRTDTWELARSIDAHADRVLALEFSPDGKRIAAGGGLPAETGEVVVWSADTGEEHWRAEPHSDTVFALDWSPDGKRIATGGADRVTYLLEADSGDVVQRIEGHTHHVLGVALSPDGKQLATAGADEVLRLWDLDTYGAMRQNGKHEGAVTAVEYRDDGKEIATVSEDGNFRLWDPKNNRARRRYGEAKGVLQAGAFFAGRKHYASAEQSGAVRVYELERNRLLLTVEAPENGRVRVAP